MSLIKRVLLLQVFDEDKDVFNGPPWAVRAFVFVSVLNLVALAAFLLVALKFSDAWLIQAYAAMTGSFALLCGLAWHCGLYNRAKNGLVLALFLNAVLFIVSR